LTGADSTIFGQILVEANSAECTKISIVAKFSQISVVVNLDDLDRILVGIDLIEFNQISAKANSIEYN